MDASKESKDSSSANEKQVDQSSKCEFLIDAKDGNPPSSVYEAFNQYSPNTASEAMNLLLHVAMLESNFILYDKDGSKSLPNTWRDIATTLKYCQPKLNFVCTIVIVTMGSTKQVLANFVGQDSEICFKFDLETYIKSSSPKPQCLNKLSHFMCHFRNSLLYPLQISAHEILGLPAPWHLCGLPFEIMLNIFKFTSIREILNLRGSCKTMETLIENKRVWFNTFKRDFPFEVETNDSINSRNWKDEYKKNYLKKKNGDREKKRPFHEHLLEVTHPRRIIPGIIPFRNPLLPDMPAPYGPPEALFPDMMPSPLSPFNDPDSQYFSGELGPRRPRVPHNPYGPNRSGGPRGPRIQFL